MRNETVSLEAFWDKSGDGKLVYHASAFADGLGIEPLLEMTIAFSPTARHYLSDAVCQRLAEWLDCEEMRLALQKAGEDEVL
jgi:hypothetical protein